MLGFLKFWLKIGLFASIPLFIYVGVYSESKNLWNKPRLTPQPVVESSYFEQIKPSQVPIPSPTLKVIKKIIPTANPDPLVNCNINKKCGGGTKQIKQSECNNSTCCDFGGDWYFYTSTSKCKEDQEKYWSLRNSNNSNAYNPNSGLNPSPNITCIVSYPCTGKYYTYQVDQETCNFMQSGAASTCSTINAINQMNEIVNEPLPQIVVPTIDASIHIDPLPTPIQVPVGYH